MTDVSNDHYYSQFLFKPFLDRGELWIFDKKTKRIIRKPTRSICCEKGYTTFPADQIPQGIGELKNGRFLENWLSDKERVSSLIISKLLRERTLKAVSHEEFFHLIQFMLLLYHINPSMRDLLAQFKSKTTRIWEGGLRQSEFFSICLGRIESQIDLVMDQYAWILYDFKDLGDVLYSSDRPVLLATETGLTAPVGFDTRGANLFFPLSPDLCLTGRNVGTENFINNRYIVKDPKMALLPKIITWTKSKRYIIASRRDLLPMPGESIDSYLPYTLETKDGIAMVIR